MSFKQIAIWFVLLVFMGAVRAGSTAAVLKGESASGRTKLNVVIQDAAYEVIKAELIVDGVKLNFDDRCKSHTIADFKNGVYTIYIDQDTVYEDENHSVKFIKFWALPLSFTKSDDCNKMYTFKAKIVATDPRNPQNLNISTIELNCTLEYCI